MAIPALTGTRHNDRSRDAQRPGRWIPHPIRAFEHQAENLRQIVTEGDSAATAAILIGTWIAIVVPLVSLVVALALVVAHLVTR